MLEIFNNPFVEIVVSAGIAIFGLTIAYLEIPPKKHRKTGKVRPLSERITDTSRSGKWYFFIGIMFTIATICTIISIFI